MRLISKPIHIHRGISQLKIRLAPSLIAGESLYNKVISSDVWSVGISTSDNLFWEVASGKDITSVLESYKTKWNSDIKTFYNSAVVK